MAADVRPEDPMVREVLEILPPARFAFAYGSGVIPQQHGISWPRGNRMLDFILAVDDPLTWHTRNLQLNPSHYSPLMRTLGPRAIASLQQAHFGARVYFNTLIPFRSSSRLFKYGVISTGSLLTDLRTWNTLYISGRLHKPVQTLVPDPTITRANASNLLTAAAAALLTLPPTFSERAFYRAAAALSYAADFRLALRAESPRKIHDLVAPNLSRFRALYAPARARLADALHAPLPAPAWSQATSAQSLAALLALLPAPILVRMQAALRPAPGLLAALARPRPAAPEPALGPALPETLATFGRPRCASALMAAVRSVVWSSSWRQGLKGVFTAGLVRSVAYARNKLRKGWMTPGVG